MAYCGIFFSVKLSSIEVHVAVGEQLGGGAIGGAIGGGGGAEQLWASHGDA